jgi:hypothetical protein
MNDYDSVVKIEKIMTALDLFNFDDKKINKLVKNELKKIGKNNEFIY